MTEGRTATHRRTAVGITGIALTAVVVGLVTTWFVADQRSREEARLLESRVGQADHVVRTLEELAITTTAAAQGALDASEPADHTRSLQSLHDVSTMVTAIAVIDPAGTVTASTGTPSLLVGAAGPVESSDLPRESTRLAVVDTTGPSPRLAFIGSRPSGPRVGVELTLPEGGMSALGGLSPATGFELTITDGAPGAAALTTGEVPSHRTAVRDVRFGSRSARLTVWSTDTHRSFGPWLMGLGAAIVTAFVLTTVWSIFGWRRRRRSISSEVPALERALDERRRTELDRDESNARLDAILGSSPDAIGFLEPVSGRCELLNRSSLFGATSADLARDGFLPLVHPDDQVRMRVWWSMQSGSPSSTTFRVLDPHGLVLHVALRVVRVDGWGLELRHRCLALFTDITEFHAQHERELRLTAAVQDARHMESLGRLAGGIAHDFNNILATVNLQTEKLAERTGERDARSVQTIHQAISRAAGMVRQLLEFARRDPGDPRSLDLTAAVLAIESLIRHTAGPQVQVQLDLARGGCVVRADPSQIDRLVLNLVGNARDAMPDGGELVIRTALVTHWDGDTRVHSDTQVVLEVRDSGVGMDAETIARAFEPFFTTKQEHGTGLGLSTVHGIITGLGGQIRISSDPGSGTSIVMHVPAETVQPAGSHQSTTTATTTRSPSGAQP